MIWRLAVTWDIFNKRKKLPLKENFLKAQLSHSENISFS